MSDFFTGATTRPVQNPDLDTYLADMFNGTRTQSLPFNAGPVSGFYGEERPATTANPIGLPEPDPVRRGDIGLGGDLAPGIKARINAGLQQDRTGAPLQITPGAQVNLGPVFLRGGLNGLALNQPEGTDPAYLRPTYGGGVNLPLAGGEASLGFNVVPGQSKGIDAAWGRELAGGNVGLRLGYDQPNEGRPNWRIGLGGRIPF
jgi:hypothetical protein